MDGLESTFNECWDIVIDLFESHKINYVFALGNHDVQFKLSSKQEFREDFESKKLYKRYLKDAYDEIEKKIKMSEYNLFVADEVEQYIKQHKKLKNNQTPEKTKKSKMRVQQELKKTLKLKKKTNLK